MPSFTHNKSLHLEFLTCFENNTFALNETIHEAFLHVQEKRNMLNSSYWTKTPGNVFMGMCHTFQYPEPLQADMVKDGFGFTLDPELSYTVIVHDPKYYIMGSNPLVFPRMWLTYKVKGTGGILKPGLKFLSFSCQG